MTEPYDLRSNIKGKPGSQGTLFQVKDKGLLNPAQRWPRGYTPERQAEVRGALEPVKMHVDDTWVQSPEKRAQVTRAVAQSTVPPEHLEGLRAVMPRPQAGHNATYWPGRKEIGIHMTDGMYGGINEASKSLIHEIGHHVDNTVTHQTANELKDRESERAITHPDEHVIDRKVEVRSAESGIAEGVADNYYEEHYRTGGRNSQPVTQGRYEAKGMADKYPGYRDVRPAPHMGPQFHEDTALPGMPGKRDDANRWAVGENK